MPGGGSSSKDVTSSVLKSEPPAYLGDNLKYVTDKFRQAYDSGQLTPRAPDFSTVVNQSPETIRALEGTAARAINGSGAANSAQNYVKGILGGQGFNQNAPGNQYFNAAANGSFLSAGNPYFQGTSNAINRATIDQYNNTVAPSINATFSQAGRYGSGAHQNAVNNAQQSLARQLSDTNSQLGFQNYSQERGLQQQAAGALSQNYNAERDRQGQAVGQALDLAQNDYRDLGALSSVGQQREGQAQAQLNDLVNRFYVNQDANYNALNRFRAGLDGNSFGNTQTQITPQYRNQYAGGLGGLFAGAGLGQQYGGGIGAGIGGLLGGLGGFFL